MFDRLTASLSSALKSLSGRGRLTDDNISDTVRAVRLALLDADVALPVVKSFTDAVRARAVGVEVSKSLTPGQAFIKVVHEELTALMGEASTGLNLRAQRPVVVMLAGLQGAGKTTSAGKLARWLIEKQNKKVLMVSTDVYRPAAILQLQTLAEQVGAGFAPAMATEAPVAIAKRALTEATLQAYDVLLLDTAGRLHVDAEMMAEVRELEAAIQPHERLFVVDSMAGQDAVNAAKAFNEALSLTGVILTKADGDARGGAALSVRHVTGKPILFVGMGEKSDALELFQPERIASRILGMGDVLSLVEQVQEQVDQEKAEKLAKKISKGKSFDLTDLRDQLSQLQNMGGMAALLDKLPAQMQVNAAAAAGTVNAKSLKRQMGIIDSMTPRERRRPEMIDNSRKRRIANGAGVPLPEVNRLLKQFDQMQKTMKKLVKGGMLKNMMRGMAGRLPPGGFGPGGLGR
ncbi:MAG: signal recognition particle subunit [Gammaproteobacteria bacterium]|jgi:signal recognition particle subunit SRP54|nr:signal recognition particle subunit [Gammaproteobacteria bacterium]